MNGHASRGAIVVTGAASGIGAACALRLDQVGFHVFAGVLPGEDSRLLRQAASEQLRILELDVTDPTSILAAARTVTAEVGHDGLAGLVNNAGLAISGPLELFPINAFRELLDVNVVGPIAVTQAFLPLLRLRKGRIVMIGSAGGTVPVPLTGPYSASKSALRILTSVLRLELRNERLPVSIVIPGAVATPIWEKAARKLDDIVAGALPEARDRYAPFVTASQEYLRRSDLPRLRPEMVALAVEQALTVAKPKRCYLVGRGARFAELVRFLPLPEAGIEWLVERAIGAATKRKRAAPLSGA